MKYPWNFLGRFCLFTALGRGIDLTNMEDEYDNMVIHYGIAPPHSMSNRDTNMLLILHQDFHGIYTWNRDTILGSGEFWDISVKWFSTSGGEITKEWLALGCLAL